MYEPRTNLQKMVRRRFAGFDKKQHPTNLQRTSNEPAKNGSQDLIKNNIPRTNNEQKTNRERTIKKYKKL